MQTSSAPLTPNSPATYGLFVNIMQQDGSKVRMDYPWDENTIHTVKWIGINEQMAEKYAGANQ